MVINLEANDFNRQTRFLRNDNNILMTMGAGTYSVLAAMETAHLKRSHVLVGNFSSLANRIRFIIGQNHITTDSGWISTYPFDQFDVKVRDGIEQHNFAANHYQVVIGNDVWIGMDVQIMAGVHIGDGAIIGADAVIAKDVPPYAVVVGNPARIIKYRFDKETIDKLLKIRWWLWDNETLEARRQYMKDTKTFIEKFYEKPKKYEETQLIQLLKQEKKGGKFIYAALSDASDPTHTIVEIVQSYKSAFPQNTPVLLVIVTENDAVYQNLEEQLKTFDCPCPIYLASRAELEGVIANSNVIFTNRLDISSRAVEFATQYNIEIRSALDYDVFNKEKFLLKA